MVKRTKNFNMKKTLKLFYFIILIIGLILFNSCKFEIPIIDPGNKVCSNITEVEKITTIFLEKGDEIVPIKKGSKKFTIINKKKDTQSPILTKDDLHFNVDGKPISWNKKDTIEVIENYYCNQILISFHDTISPIDKIKAQKHLIDTLGLGLVKQCPCSNFEIWGRDANQPIDPNERDRGKRGKIAQNGSGEKFLFKSSLNFIMPLPSKIDTIFDRESKDTTINIPPRPPIKNTVRVAVIDSGIEGHEEYRWENQFELTGIINKDDNVPKNYYVDDSFGFDFVNNKGIINKNDSDVNGHGTHISGIIVGADIAKHTQVDLELMDLKIFHDSTANLFDLVCATNYAVKNGANIINQSLGFYSTNAPQVLEDVFSFARDNNVLIITSAGNDGLNNDNLVSINDPKIVLHHYPSDVELDNIISVGAISKNLDNYLWIEDSIGSNYGQIYVDVSAKGEQILSTYINGSAILSGTSMAAGQITRIAAIHRYERNILNYSDLKDCILHQASIGTMQLNGLKPIKTDFGIFSAISNNDPACQ